MIIMNFKLIILFNLGNLFEVEKLFDFVLKEDLTYLKLKRHPNSLKMRIYLYSEIRKGFRST